MSEQRVSIGFRAEANDKRGTLNRYLIIKAFLVFCISVAAFPVDYLPTQTGLDFSWLFALNYFHANHILFGRDVIFTYGPLGFLDFPMDLGHNLCMGIAFQLAVWLSFVALVAWLALKDVFTARNLFVFSIFLTAGRIFSGFDSLDIFVYLTLMLIAFSLFAKRWYISFMVALIFSALLLFFKFSSAITAVSSAMLFALANLFIDKKRGIQSCLLAFFGMPALFAAFFMIYDPSFADMLSYLRGAFEISSGYSIAMSGAVSTASLVSALLVLAGYVFYGFLLLKDKKEFSLLYFVLTGPLFLAFKEGFVRSDSGHVMLFFGSAFYFLGLIFLFTGNSNRYKKSKTVIIAALFSVSLLAWNDISANAKENLQGINPVGTISDLADFSGLKKNLNETSQEKLYADRFSNGYTVGGETVGIFPYEVAYAAANRLNYVPFPVFQTYSAYTPYLDHLNAGFLEDGSKAPEYILMNFKYDLVYRHPLIDAPATWLSMYKWYDAVGYLESMGSPQQPNIVLKRREQARFESIEFICRKKYKTGEFIEIPHSDRPVVAKIYMDLNLRGRVADFFYKIPPVLALIETEYGETYGIRITPAVLRDGLLVTYIPSARDADSFIDFINKGEEPYKISGFEITGPGAEFYKTGIVAEFYRIPNIGIKENRIFSGR